MQRSRMGYLATRGRVHHMPFGATISQNGTWFRLWAPKCANVQLVLSEAETVPMRTNGQGWHEIEVPGVTAGTLYRFALPDRSLIADPASRFQPQGLDGPSAVIDPTLFQWTDKAWVGRDWEEAILYELHIGAFTESGTWASAIERLDHLADLGITAIQIMPVAQCYGRFNWGYDGASWYAPMNSYGSPDDMRAFVDAAHARSMMVLLDVVYNHFGPIGNDLEKLTPIFTDRHNTPWGCAINFDAEGSSFARSFVIDNALYWLTEFNLDGLRLDAIHELKDDSNTHILEILSARIRSAFPARKIHLVVENSDNGASWLRRDNESQPVFYTAQWNDDLHHVLHTATTGEAGGYYADFLDDDVVFDKLGRALREGFIFQGEYKLHEGRNRGEPSAALPPQAFISYMQNHDQVGNRIQGSRISHFTSAAAVHAYIAIYLLSPQIPMIFMGEEFGATTAFPFFSDVPDDMRESVIEGRMRDMRGNSEDIDPTKPDVEETYDPTSEATFMRAKIDWVEAEENHGQQMLRIYRTLIDLRQREIVPRLKAMAGFSAHGKRMGRSSMFTTWIMGDGAVLRAYINLSHVSEESTVPLIGRKIWQTGWADGQMLGPWSVLWTIEV